MHISQPGCHGVPVLMIHGMVEDGRIFYHKSGKGLGSYLAGQGYDVYCADLRGIGQSTPKINRHSQHGQSETIEQDIPALIDFVLKHSGQKKLHLVAHSWGGVVINACLIRYPQLIKRIYSCAFFGSKRSVRARTFERYLKVEMIWNRLTFAITQRNGYLPARRYKLGSDNETRKTHRQCVRWVKQQQWIDDDGLDYQQQALNTQLPATLYYAAISDLSLGHRHDVKRFIAECGPHQSDYRLLAKKTGHALDYDHINMLTAPEAVTDHFPQLLHWLAQHQLLNPSHSPAINKRCNNSNKEQPIS